MIALQFVRFSAIQNLSSDERLKKIIDIAKEEKIVILEGRLKKEEEARLIAKTMEEINEDFKGIELQVISSNEESKSVFGKLKLKFTNALLGDKTGFTIIGPASLVKEIRKDPDSILLLTHKIKRQTRKV